MAATLDLNRFKAIMAEYSDAYENAPSSTAQVVQFCKSKSYPFRYGDLNPMFMVWKKHSTPRSPITSGAPSTPMGSPDSDAIDWDSIWSEYEVKYQNAPKKALHLFTFAKEEKGLSIRYKTARDAFTRIAAERQSMEGQVASAPSALALETNGQSANMTPTKSLALVFPKKRSRTSDDVELAKTQFLELLTQFRSSIMHDPASPLQLFHFINDSTSYKARYGDVKRCYEMALKEKWFRPMKRTKKGGKKKAPKVDEGNETEVDGESGDEEEDGNSSGEEEGVHFVLEIDEEAERKQRMKEEEERKEIVPQDVMDDETFTVLLAGYTAKYKNPPRNASQIMHFAKEEGQHFRYKACRVAFQRWKNIWNK